MSASKEIILPDHSERDRFIEGLSSNFGVIAPAGVGKTHSIVGRIAAMAREPNATELLQTLVVVTYTNRAAQEMQRRARATILSETTNLEILGAFNRAFFGTIHSFCLRLLQSHGHAIGVPAHAQLLQDDAELWGRFVATRDGFGEMGGEPWVEKLLRHVPATTVFALARQLDPRTVPPEAMEDCPEIDAGAILGFTPQNKRGQEKIEQDQARLRRWMDDWRAGNDFLPLIEPSSGTAAFVEVWNETMEPLREWLGRATLRVASGLAREYQDYRVTSGFLTYDDQVTLAAELLRHPPVARQIRRENYRVILDEAQDTDPEQFFVLLESAKDPENPGAVPRPGHFAMVGDFQQSIYGDRADLFLYRTLHRKLAEAAGGGEAKFSVTFRCARKIVDFVNEAFPSIFSGDGGQVDFVPLQPKPGAAEGQVARVPTVALAKAEDGKKIREADRVEAEAPQVAEFIRKAGLSGLRAREWGQVAILCPRTRWFAPLVEALEREGIPCQLHSVREIAGDSPVYAWLCALLWVMAHPRDSYEITGVLREIFGVSDHDLAEFANSGGAIFQIEQKNSGNGIVAEKLNELASLRREAIHLPLRDAVRCIAGGVFLRERLLSLPEDVTGGEVDRELDDLLIVASMAETDGTPFLEFAQKLKDGFYRPRETETVRRDAVQIMTCQKAKGLEWDAVIVPFLFRKIGSMSPRYPLCRKGPGGAEPTVLLSGKDADEAQKMAIQEAKWQEYERLLYVTCTRARQTLVLFDDAELFENGSKKEPVFCFGNMLVRRNQGNLPLWESLPAVVTPGKESTGELVKTEEKKDASVISGGIADMGAARKRSVEFPRRITPHALATHISAEEPELRLDRDDDRPDVDSQTPATLYGTWWHGLMEAVPWRLERKHWDGVFERLLPESIDAERSKREWELFQRSPLAALLNRKEWIFQAEMPFLWRSGPDQVIEGVMDLAVFDPQSEKWLVVDWKTNRLGNRGMDELVETYNAQLRAYIQALGEMFKRPVGGILYSTTRGEHREL